MAKAEDMKVSGYHTHQPLLVKYLLKAKPGDTIIELGTGLFSTPIIYEFSKALGLNYKIYSSDKKWMDKVKPFAPDADWNFVENWETWKLKLREDSNGEVEKAFLIMLDNEELVINRYKQIEKNLIKNAEYILLHDSDIYHKRGCNLKKYVGDEYTELIPNTFVIDVEKSKNKPSQHIKPSKPIKELHLSLKEKGNKYKDNRLDNLKNIRTAVVCCYVEGGDYDNHYKEYIRRLSEGVHSNTEKNVDFYCITDADIGDIKNVEKIEPLKKDWKKWHIKAEIFRPELWKEYDRVLYIDLDTQILKNIDDIIYSNKRLLLLRDFYQPNVRETGMIYFKPVDFAGLYSVFKALNPRDLDKDADIICKFIDNKKLIPEYFQDIFKIGSYKCSLLLKNAEIGRFQIICYHGIPRPHELNWNPRNKIRTTGANRRVIPTNNDNMERYSLIKPIWAREDCFIIGGGPSLKNVDLDKLLKNYNVLGINDGYQFNCCDICFYGDDVWYKAHKNELHKYINSGKSVYTCSHPIGDKLVKLLARIPKGLSISNNTVGWNCNSGFSGINLALHLGAKNIFLLGFDMQFSSDNQSNWHENIRKVSNNSYTCFLGNEKFVADDLKKYFPEQKVYNCIIPGYDSALKHFKKIEFHKLLNLKEKDIWKTDK